MASVELGAARLIKESGEVRELKEQVDSLNKALARKEAEGDSLKKALSRKEAELAQREAEVAQVDSLKKALARKEAELAQSQSQYKIHTPRRLSQVL